MALSISIRHLGFPYSPVSWYGCSILQGRSILLIVKLQIALGTVILLAGVLALSWRLNNDHISQTPIPQTPLTPGMGFPQPDGDQEEEGSSSPTADEESQLLPNRLRSQSQPTTLPSKTGFHGTDKNNANGNKRASFSGSMKRSLRFSSAPLIANARNSDMLNVTRARRTTMAEVEEIWGELEEDTPTPLASPFSLRRLSARSTPVRDRPSNSLMSSGELPQVDESTSLLARSSTGRSYRDRRRRRSAPLENEREGKAQAAFGGLWKMRWWQNQGPPPGDGAGQTDE